MNLRIFMRSCLRAVRSCYFLVLLAFCSPDSWGQPGGDARTMAMGQVRTLPGDFWATANNPGVLATGRITCIGISAMNRYLVKEMKDLSFTFRLSDKRNGFGLSGHISGISTYLRQHYCLAYGRHLGPHISTGIGLDYFNLNASDGYKIVHGITFKIGTISRIGDRISLGFLGMNPFGISFTSDKSYKIPSSYTGSIIYSIEENIFLVIEIEADTDHKASVKCGGEYGFKEIFFLRLGAMSRPFRITSGAGFSLPYLNIDISVQYHSWLGFSPGISVIYRLKSLLNAEGQ